MLEVSSDILLQLLLVLGAGLGTMFKRYRKTGFWSTYVITNDVNGKRYIGITSKTLGRRLAEHFRDAKHGHRYVLCSAIRKYGEESFSISLLEKTRSIEDAQASESKFIEHYNTYCGSRNARGYNLSFGGENPDFGEAALGSDVDLDCVSEVGGEADSTIRDVDKGLGKLSGDTSADKLTCDQGSKSKINSPQKSKAYNSDHRQMQVDELLRQNKILKQQLREIDRKLFKDLQSGVTEKSVNWAKVERLFKTILPRVLKKKFVLKCKHCGSEISGGPPTWPLMLICPVCNGKTLNRNALRIIGWIIKKM